MCDVAAGAETVNGIGWDEINEAIDAAADRAFWDYFGQPGADDSVIGVKRVGVFEIFEAIIDVLERDPDFMGAVLSQVIRNKIKRDLLSDEEAEKAVGQ